MLSRMTHVARRLLAVAGASCVPLVLLGAQAPAPPAATAQAVSQPPAEVLRPGGPVERPLAPDETRRFTLPLQAGDFVEITVEQLGIDAIVALTGPDGAAIDEVDDTSELDGPERVRVIAGAAGDYALAVRSEPLPTVRAGRCRLVVGERRPATDADRAVAAERRAATERFTTLQARYDEMRKTGRHEATEDAQLADAFGDVARLALDAGRLRQADRARAPQAYILLIQDRSPEVIAIVERRLAWLKGARYMAARASALTQLAEASSRIGESARAIELFQEALTIPQTRANEAITRDNLGATLRRVGRLQEALEAHQRALEYFQANGPKRSVAVVLGRLGLVWRQLGDITRTIAYDQQSLDILVEIDDKPGIVRGLTNLAADQREAGLYDLSRTTAERALRAAIEGKTAFLEAHASLVLANLELRVGNLAAAVERGKRSAALFREQEYKAGEVEALWPVGEAQLRLGQVAEAEETLLQALAIAREVGNPDDEAAVLGSVARLARARGRLTDARVALDEALACIERIRATLGGAALRASLVSFNHGVYEDHVDVLASLHRERPTEGFDRQALEASELSRARSLLDVLATSSIDIRAGVDASLLDRERALRQRLADKDVARHRAEDNGQTAAVAAIEREIGELTDALRAAESAVAASGPGFIALTRPRAVDVDALRRDVLDGDTVLLEYAVGDERTWLFALTPATLDAFELPGRTRLDPLVRAAIDAVTAHQHDGAAQDAAHDAALRTALGELSTALLGPIADRLRGAWQGRRLVVVPSGALEYVPFAALPLPGGAGAPAVPLVAAHEVVSAPSAATIAALRRETAGRAPAAKTLAIVADPVFEADDPRVARARLTHAAPARPAVVPASNPAPAPVGVPATLIASRGPTREPVGRLLFSRREATALTAMLPATERLLVTDFAATRRWALEAPLDRYRIVHFATHGLIDAERPALSSLVLSLVDERGTPIDGYLRMADIYNRRLPVDLVVLSACRTALGADLQGEGLVGLTRGFMYAGARRVVASLWQVDDQATSQLMTRFYRHMLTGGEPPAAALRAAQRELAADPRFSAPYFWAGFVLHGDWRR